MTTMAAAVAVLALGSTQASADGVNGDSQQFVISATVQNAVALGETQAIDFGTFVVVTDGTGIAIDPALAAILDPLTGIVNWGGSGATGTGILGDEWGTVSQPRMFPTGVRPSTNGIYTIAGAAFFAQMQIVYNNDPTGATATTLTCGACASAPPTFTVDTFTDDTVGGIVATDGAGAATVHIGATIHADNTADNTTVALLGAGTLGMGAGPVVIGGTYEDGDYTGNLVISAVY